MSGQYREILPFPNTIDRDSFGWYISGFTDGEGCFALLTGKMRRSPRPTPCASFVIKLRNDDDGVLKLMQSYFQCGRVAYGRTRDQCDLRFRTLADLPVIVRHFDTFPLFAKKRHDFAIWREGVAMILDISKRYQKRLGRGHGIEHKWKKAEYERFLELKHLLSQRTVPKKETVELPAPVKPQDFITLF